MEGFVIVAIYIMFFAVPAIAYWLVTWAYFLITNALDDKRRMKEKSTL